MRAIYYRKNVSVRLEMELYHMLVEESEEKGLTVSNTIENMCKKGLGLPIDKKATKRGRKRNEENNQST